MRATSIAWALVVLVGLMGCQKTPRKAAGPPRKIRVAYTWQPESTLVHVAMAKGYFAEEGLETQPVMSTFGKAALQSLLDHKADFATVGETPIMFSALKGEPFRVIASFVSSNTNNGIVARRDAGIEKGADLKGKRIGFTPGTTSDFFLDSQLTALGLARQAIRPVALKPEEMREAIHAKTVDAACTWNYPLTEIRRDLGAAGILFVDRDIYTENFVIAVSKDLLQKEPETAQRFLQALIRAEAFVAQHRDEAQAIVATATKTDLGLVREVWDTFKLEVKLDQSLLITLEDETRWAMKHKLTDQTVMPDYRIFIHADSLRAAHAAAARATR